MTDRGFTIGGLGEIAIRCVDLPRMRAFYEDTLGLTPLDRGDRGGIVFFSIAPGVAGHTQVLALFQSTDETPRAGVASTLHHIALGVTVQDQGAAMAWFDAQGVAWRTETFGWIGWRGLFVTDPDGNTVELVAADPSFRDRNASP